MDSDSISGPINHDAWLAGSLQQKRKETEGSVLIQRENESQIDWGTKCCCTSRMKFSDADNQGGFFEDEHESSAQEIIDEIAGAISSYRRESVLSVVSEFEKKLLTLGMSGSVDPEDSSSDRSEDEVNIRRSSELAPKPEVLTLVENRRSTAPQNLQKRMIQQLNIAINEENTEDLEQIPN